MAKKRSLRVPASVQMRARELRRTMTPAEARLWTRLRNRRLSGLKFRCQHPLGRYIADFYCAAHRLVVEIDGGIHTTRAEADELRSENLEALSFRVIRFTNQEVETELETVLQKILEAVG